MKTSGHRSLEKYTSHFIWKGCVWEGVGDRTELQHIDPHSYGHNSVSFSFSWAAQLGAWGPSLSRTWFSFEHLLSNCNCSIRALRAPSAECWFFLQHLIPNWLKLPFHRVILLSYTHSISSHNVANGICNFRCLWNGMFDHHRAEITVMQFTGHPLPVHQFVTALVP